MKREKNHRLLCLDLSVDEPDAIYKKNNKKKDRNETEVYVR